MSPWPIGRAAVDLAQPRSQTPVAAQMQGRAVGRQQVEARDLVTGDVRERVERDPQDFVDVERGADRGADPVQDAHVRFDVDRRRAHRAADQLAQLPQPLVAMVLEGERVALVVGAHEDRRNLELGLALRQGDREGRHARGTAPTLAAHLDARCAQIDRRRFPFGAALLADPDRQRDQRPRCAATLGLAFLGLGLLARDRRFEARERLLQTSQRDGLADEVEGAGPQGLLRLALGRASGDHEDRHPQIADRLELHEIEPTHAGQAHVEEDRVRALDAQGVERCLGRVRDDRLVADLVEELPEDLADSLIVVDDQYAHGFLAAKGYPSSSNRHTTGYWSITICYIRSFRKLPHPENG